jgi:hypothetical protein
LAVRGQETKDMNLGKFLLKNHRFFQFRLIANMLFYLEIILLIGVIGHIIYNQFSWLPPTIALIISVLMFFVFGDKKPFKKWIQTFHERIKRNLLASKKGLIILHTFLLPLIVLAVFIDARLISARQSHVCMQTYRENLTALKSEDVTERIPAAKTITRIFLKYKNPSDILPGLVKICEDPVSRVHLYCEEPLKSSHFKNEPLALEFECLISERLYNLRQTHCKPSFSYTGKELIELSRRFYNLLLTFKTISQYIKSPEYKNGLDGQDGICHEIVYESLNILALLISANNPKTNLTFEEASSLMIAINRIKELLRSKPFEERYRFITDPNKQTIYAPIPTWYLTIKFRIKQFIDKEEVNSIFEQVLKEPWTQ